jgi:NDP-sugar pyrophosphorylase family protein
MLGYEVKEYFPGGYLVINSRKELTRIEEKPEPGSVPSNIVNILLHIHRDPGLLLKHIEKVKTSRDDVYERALYEMLRNRHVIKVVPYRGHWAPIKYPWHILNVARYYLDCSRPYIAPTASISDRATITGKVIIGDNARVLENAVIRGPAYIGPGTIIGNNALVRDYSHIGADCVVGFSTEVKTSYIGNNCWFHSSYIGDSVIGNNCSFGAGTVTANFRFDAGEIPVRYGDVPVKSGRDKLGAVVGDNCKTGINSGILPGRRVGPNSIIGSQVLLTTDLEPGSIIMNQPDFQIKKIKIKSGINKRRQLNRRLDNR